MRYRAEAVTAFLACLELIRLGVVRAFQTRAFAEIHATPHGAAVFTPEQIRDTYSEWPHDEPRDPPETDAEPRAAGGLARTRREDPAGPRGRCSSRRPAPSRRRTWPTSSRRRPQAVAEALARSGRPHADADERGVRAREGRGRLALRHAARVRLAAAQVSRGHRAQPPVARGPRDPRDHRLPPADHAARDPGDPRRQLLERAEHAPREEAHHDGRAASPWSASPFLYRTTQDFLVRFGLNDLDGAARGPRSSARTSRRRVEAPRDRGADGDGRRSIHVEDGDDRRPRTSDGDDGRAGEDRGRRASMPPDPDPEDSSPKRALASRREAEELDPRRPRPRQRPRRRRSASAPTRRRTPIKVDEQARPSASRRRRPTSCSTSRRASSRPSPIRRAGDTVLDLLPGKLRRGVKPVGRLDVQTEGLLLLTDDGDLARLRDAPLDRLPQGVPGQGLRGARRVEARAAAPGGILLDGARTRPAGSSACPARRAGPRRRATPGSA